MDILFQFSNYKKTPTNKQGNKQTKPNSVFLGKNKIL